MSLKAINNSSQSTHKGVSKIFLIQNHKMKNIEEHNFNGFRYFASYENGELPKIDHHKEVPEFLFKYYSLSEYNVEAMINSNLYASHPFELNDILDSSRFLFHASQPIQFEAYKKLYLKVFHTPEKLTRFYDNDIKNDCSDYISHLYSLISTTYGVISVSENESDEFMWPHYTQEKGFQVKFNSKVLRKTIIDKLTPGSRFIGLFPLNYTCKILPIDVSKFRRFDIPFIYSTNIKFNKWIYENEWRFIISKPKMGIPFGKLGFSDVEDHKFTPVNRYIQYDIDSVETICLGMNFFSGRDFVIEWKGDRDIIIEPLKNAINYRIYLSFLNFVTERLSDKIFVSGIKYEINDKNMVILARTREKDKIEKVNQLKFKITRSEEVIKY
jgi:hypothetical protein